MTGAPKRRPPALGRGLSALLGEPAGRETAGEGGGRELPLDAITPDPEQPRRHFDDAALAELTESIRVRGVLQPIVVRSGEDAERFVIVAGERRWRAARAAGLRTIPALVRDFAGSERLEVALIENIQREQLNAVEEGAAYRRLIADHGHTADGLAQLLHKSRSHVANLMRLAELPERVRAMVVDGRLTMGHARALVGHPQAEALAERIVAGHLSVRAAEALAKAGPATMRRPRKPKGSAGAPDADIALLERQLGDLLGLPVAIAHAGGTGSVTVRYGSLEQLDLVCQRLSAGAV